MSEIFISYGHNVHDDLVAEFAEQLREVGHDVFLDTDYLHYGDWERIIDEHIIASKCFVFMVSARSVSTDGYCLNELCRALELGKLTVPVVLDSSMLPLSINRYQRHYLSEAVLKKVVEEVSDIAEGRVRQGFADIDLMLKNCLRPMSYTDELSRHYGSFKGRREAFSEFEDFMAGTEPIMWVPASPGTGKTAFSTMLCWNYQDMVAGVHFCKFNNSDKTDPKRIIMSLAYQLAGYLPEYRAKLLGLTELQDVYCKSEDRIFEYLLVEPLLDIQPGRNYALVIDALDEASLNGDNAMCGVLHRAKLRGALVPWLKFVLTSRNEVEVSKYLGHGMSFVSLRFTETTDDDIREFYLDQFPYIDEEKMSILLNKSEGSFLYAVEITKQIKGDVLDLRNINLFPPGIFGFYNDCMNRIFSPIVGRGVAFERVRPLLGLICVFKDAVTEDVLKEFLGISRGEIRSQLLAVSGLFDIRKEGIQPVHKSLIDWLVDDTFQDHQYQIYLEDGYEILYDRLKEYYADAGSYDEYYLVKYYGKTLMELRKTKELIGMLNNYEFISARNRTLHFDTGLREYLGEIAFCGNDRDAVFRSPTFISVFEENRRLLYNSGMFFILRDLGFTEILSSGKMDFSLEGKIGVAFYYYIVEEFEKAIVQCCSLLKEDDLLPVCAAELLNIKGLSERKLVRFDDAVASFKGAISKVSEVVELEDARHSDPQYELSMAHLILGKIYTNMLDFNAADASLDMAVKVLKKRIDELPDGDDRTAKLLFLAEEYRVYAYTCIWEGDYDKAERLLNECNTIYMENKSSTDRYFIRYKYTLAFLRLMTCSHKGIEVLLESLLESARGKYDIGTINTYLGLHYAMEGDDEAVCYLAKSQEIFRRINAYLELDEAMMIENIFNNLHSRDARKEYVQANDYVIRWLEYAGQKVRMIMSQELV